MNKTPIYEQTVIIYLTKSTFSRILEVIAFRMIFELLFFNISSFNSSIHPLSIIFHLSKAGSFATQEQQLYSEIPLGVGAAFPNLTEQTQTFSHLPRLHDH